MTTTIISVYQKIKVSVLYDLIALSIFYSVPTLVHWFSFPLYYFDPMRLLVLSSLLFTDRKNAYVLAFTLPVFAHFMGGHPSLLKSLLIGTELIVNVYGFFLISKRISLLWIPITISTIISKILYYAIKHLMINIGLLNDTLFSTPILFQFVIIFVLGLLFFTRQKIGLKNLKKYYC